MASITGGSLKEFVASISTFPGSSPTKKEHNPLELTLTTLTPSSFIDEPLIMQITLPGANSNSQCHVIADLFLEITLHDIDCNECVIPITISCDLFAGEVLYADLKEQLDGSYYPANKGKIYFKYIERYSVPQGKNLNYAIYSKTRQLIKNEGQPKPGMPALPIVFGTNFISLDLSRVKDMTANEFYVMEVLSDKKDKYYLRFKFIK